MAIYSQPARSELLPRPASQCFEAAAKPGMPMYPVSLRGLHADRSTQAPRNRCRHRRRPLPLLNHPLRRRHRRRPAALPTRVSPTMATSTTAWCACKVIPDVVRTLAVGAFLRCYLAESRAHRDGSATSVAPPVTGQRSTTIPAGAAVTQVQASTSMASSASAQAGVPLGTLSNGTWQVAATPQANLIISTLPAAIGSGVSVRVPKLQRLRGDFACVRRVLSRSVATQSKVKGLFTVKLAVALGSCVDGFTWFCCVIRSIQEPAAAARATMRPRS